MLVAHVESEGVWLVKGGMHRIARALAGLSMAKGASFRYEAAAAEIMTESGRVSGVRLENGERIAADAVVVNADTAAIATGLLGCGITRAAPSVAARSLSAVTVATVARTDGFPLLRHNVFFSADYKAEFDDIFRRNRVPASPTVYLCAQDRDDGPRAHSGPERLFCLINAPPNGDSHSFEPAEIERCTDRIFNRLAQSGLIVDRASAASEVTTPADFNRLFPATGGALYGPATHGWNASFRRPGSRTTVPGLYLAGGSTHPGPGVPMAALSGRLAADNLLSELGSSARSRRAAIHGGMSTR
jgi:1-hydroxycarotenoid 3,4-desaturase